MGIRVNRITVNVNQNYNESCVSLYKTNELLTTIQETELGVKTFKESGVSAKAYQLYLKDLVINLLDNDGIEGYYYEPKQESESIKYDMSSFKVRCNEYIQSVIEDKYEYAVTGRCNIVSSFQYKDMFLKDAEIEIEILLKQYDIKLLVICVMKSGQACRPKYMRYKNDELAFNITSINRIIRNQ